MISNSDYQSFIGLFWLSGGFFGFNWRNCSSPFWASNNRCACSGDISRAARAWVCPVWSSCFPSDCLPADFPLLFLLLFVILLARLILRLLILLLLLFRLRLLLVLLILLVLLLLILVLLLVLLLLLLLLALLFQQFLQLFQLHIVGILFQPALPPIPAPGGCCWKCRIARRC